MLPRPLGRLYFSSGADQQLFVKSLANDLDATQLTTGTGLITGFDVDQADGLILLSRTVGGNSDIFRMNLDGSGLIALTSDGARNQFPVIYSPTNEVYFSSQEPGTTVTQMYKMATDGTGRRFPAFNNEIMTADISGADPVRLTDLASNDFSPFWFSDTKLMWIALTYSGKPQCAVASGREIPFLPEVDSEGQGLI